MYPAPLSICHIHIPDLDISGEAKFILNDLVVFHFEFLFLWINEHKYNININAVRI